MNSIGIIYFTDLYGNTTSTYIYGATSLLSVKAYCEVLRQYSAAVMTSIEWSESAEMQYDRKKAYGERKTYVFSLPKQEMSLMYSGQPGEAYSLRNLAKCVLRNSLSHYARYAFIPAPLQSIFTRSQLNNAVGQDLAAAFSLLINIPSTFQSGYLINPLI